MSSILPIVVLTAGLHASAVIAAGADAPPAPPNCPCGEAQAMTNNRLGIIIRGIDANAEGRPGFWRFTVSQREVLVITDDNANRMRIFSGVAALDEIDEQRLLRLMQANFDSALDARYAIARGILWSAFLHPLSTLNERDFVSGIAQVVNLAVTYGTTYSSGALTFGGGDSEALIQELLERANSI